MKYTYMIKKNKHELLVIEERSHDKPYHIYIIDNSPSLEYDLRKLYISVLCFL